MSSTHHVILGAGPAGVTAAETIRKQDAFAEITLISGEEEQPYSRMAIPYLLEGKIEEDGTHLRQTAGHYDTHSINLRQGPVTAVDTAAKTVALGDGSKVGYDKLLIATGASPVRPPIEGLDQAGVHTCWTLEDARHIAKLARKGAPVVLVGAGFIGSIILESLAKAGVQLTVVEMGDRMVPRMLDETAGNMLRRWCEQQGVRVVTGTTVEAIKEAGPTPPGQAQSQAQSAAPSGATPGGQEKVGIIGRLFGISAAQPSTQSGASSTDAGGATPPVTNDNTPSPAGGAAPAGGLAVTLGNGETIPAELVVIATGVRSNTAFLDGSGIKIGDGIVVDDYLATSAADVYAAGDVAEGIDLSTGKHDMLAIQPVAVEHGYLAALNMTGSPTRHRGSLNMNVLDTLGLISSSFGLWQGVEGGDSVSKVDEAGYRYMHLEFDGDKLVGAQCVGVTDHIGMLRGLIQTGLPLGPWKQRLMEAPERLPEAYVATAQGTPGHGPTGPKVALPV